ncbi:hypothetical protein [Nitrosopumilus sp.]|uniref:hypothetical protein n=1 Tax=Nitrosopumilus sp. TaxID=2024843 RepID=UPI00292F4339|nr:hypothetical protein [Nitrosopumilus sp.]
MKNIKSTAKKSTTKEFKPEVKYEQVGASLGSVNWKNETGFSYITKFCKLCRNFDVLSRSRKTQPMSAYSSETKRTIVIPYILENHFKTIDYQYDEIISFLKKIKTKLDYAYNKWSISGHNPCTCEQVGKELTVKLKHGVEIKCRVIVDSNNDKSILRLSYGGGKITCP